MSAFRQIPVARRVDVADASALTCTGAFSLARAFVVALAFVFVVAVLSAPVSAFADDGGSLDGHEGSPCILSADERAAYEADGTLDERIAYAASLGHDSPSAGLLAQATAREQARGGTPALSVPTGWESGMATSGAAHVLTVRVFFPDMGFSENDTLDALQAIVGPAAPDAGSPKSAGAFPYESLHDYYLRSSYGQLTITGEAFDYQAKRERDYYTHNRELLFEEVLSALDATQDLTRFDANDDGRLDAVYIHFAGPDTGWGSFWWSSEEAMGYTGATYDGKALWNTVLLAEDASSPGGARTIIHETGHVLGLPDYYNADQQTSSTGELSGILTYDMMMQNLGDHNGYSKWLLGWLPEDKITRVVANEREITVTRDGQVIERHEAAGGDTLAVSVDLAAFTSDDIAQTGGIVVVSNEDKGPFSSLYVVQYDVHEGNQSVSFLAADGSPHDVPPGFRVFRVMGELTEDGQTYAHQNLFGTVHNQMIEMVDPDGASRHAASFDTAPVAEGAHGYGCVWHAGQAVTPEGYPSTNFYENAYLGFTGLTIAATRSGEDSGTVEVSFSDDARPDEVADLELTPRFDAFTNAGRLSFTPSTPVQVSDRGLFATLFIDGEAIALFDTRATGGLVETACYFDPAALSDARSCEIVYPAGMFVLAHVGEEEVLSPEVRVPLEPGRTLVDASDGFYAFTDYDTGFAISDVIACSDGARRFFEIAQGELRLCEIDSADPTRLADVRVVANDMGDGASIQAALPLEGGTSFVTVLDQTGSSTGFWVDADGVVAARADVSATGWRPRFAKSGDAVLAMSDATGGGSSIALFSPRADAEGSVDISYGWTALEGAFVSAAGGAIAFPRTVYGEESYETADAVVFASDGVAARVTEGAGADDAAAADSAAGGVCTDATAADACDVGDAAAVLAIGEPRALSAFDANEGAYYLALTSSAEEQTTGSGLVARYGENGARQAEAAVDLATSGSVFDRMRVAPGGSVALACQTVEQITGTRTAKVMRTFFVDGKTFELAGSLASAAASTGAWLADGRWGDVGASLDGVDAPLGSPADGEERAGDWEANLLHCNVTEQLDFPDGGSVDPDNPSTPDDASEKDEAASGDVPADGGLARTSDAASGAWRAAAAIGALAAVTVAASVRRRRTPDGY